MKSLIDQIRDDIIGDNTDIPTCFGKKPLVYMDYAASGRSLQKIERFIQHKVLPFYANTHTESSYTGAQISALRNEARQTIKRAANASTDDQVIFCGSGASAAINKVIDILNLRLPADLDDQYHFYEKIPPEERPVVFIGPYEHHSNELPWRESIADVIAIPLDSNGLIDLNHLESKLKEYQDRAIKIGSFSAASNVTGLISDTDLITSLLHQYGAYSFWDFAAAGPYIEINMQGSQKNKHDTAKDAVFLSPHKFIGGPSTPGILIIKKKLLNNRIPSAPSGGTVTYVTANSHSYTDHKERREEGGTPAIVESIRAGLVFKLQQMVGIETIERYEQDFIQRAIYRWAENPNIEILGNLHARRLSILSFRIKRFDKDLHYGFIVALLNDLFGIQARGGCSCAGPYGHQLLNLTPADSKALEACVSNGLSAMRPGWVRVNFNYFLDEKAFKYVLRAIEIIAESGWKLLPYYKLDLSSGIWRFQNKEPIFSTTLNDFNYFEQQDSIETASPSSHSLINHLYYAEKTILHPGTQLNIYHIHLPTQAEKVRWFATHQDIYAEGESSEWLPKLVS